MVLEFLKQFWSQSLFAVWCGCFAAGLVAEYFYRVQTQPLSGKIVNLVYSFVYAIIIFVAGPTVWIGVSAIFQLTGIGLIDLTFLSTTSFLGQAGIAVLTLIIIDLFYYWLHRAQHVIPFLWDQHAVHHSDEALNVTTGTRHHWLEFIFQAFTISLPMMILFKLPPVTISAIATTMTAWGFFIHCNLRLRLGTLSWVVCGPQVHRIHHSIEMQHKDKNFAAYFPIWDVLFGTYWHPARDEFPATGLHSNDKIVRLDQLVTWPFQQWLRKAYALVRFGSSGQAAPTQNQNLPDKPEPPQVA